MKKIEHKLDCQDVPISQTM